MCSRAVTSFLPLRQRPGVCLGRRTPSELPLSSCPPRVHSGVEKRRAILFCVGNWAKRRRTVPIFKHKKGFFTFDFIALNQHQISSFSVCLRELTVCSGERGNAASSPPAPLPVSCSERSVPVSRHGSVSLATAPAAHEFHRGNGIYGI